MNNGKINATGIPHTVYIGKCYKIIEIKLFESSCACLLGITGVEVQSLVKKGSYLPVLIPKKDKIQPSKPQTGILRPKKCRLEIINYWLAIIS
jgi:hypothetical protein